MNSLLSPLPLASERCDKRCSHNTQQTPLCYLPLFSAEVTNTIPAALWSFRRSGSWLCWRNAKKRSGTRRNTCNNSEASTLSSPIPKHKPMTESERQAMMLSTFSPLILAALVDKGVGRKEGIPCFYKTIPHSVNAAAHCCPRGDCQEQSGWPN